jgi:hypothetical protein
MATPEIANVRFQGLTTGRSYNKAVYFSDAGDVPGKWPSGGVPDANGMPFTSFAEPVALADVSIPSGMTVCTRLVVTRDGVPDAGGDLMVANQLNTIANRIALSIPFRAGQMIGLMQKAT